MRTRRKFLMAGAALGPAPPPPPLPQRAVAELRESGDDVPDD